MRPWTEHTDRYLPEYYFETAENGVQTYIVRRQRPVHAVCLTVDDSIFAERLCAVLNKED